MNRIDTALFLSCGEFKMLPFCSEAELYLAIQRRTVTVGLQHKNKQKIFVTFYSLHICTNTEKCYSMSQHTVN